MKIYQLTRSYDHARQDDNLGFSKHKKQRKEKQFVLKDLLLKVFGNQRDLVSEQERSVISLKNITV